MEIIKVVDKLAEYGYVRPSKISGNYYQICCPIHNNGNERRPSCGVLLHDEYRNGTTYKEGWCHCFACGWSKSIEETITRILKDRSINQTGVEWLTEHFPDYEVNDDFETILPDSLVEQLVNKYSIKQIEIMTNQTPQQFVSEEELASYRYTVPYMYERKLTDAVIEAYDIGYDAKWTAPGRAKPTPCITFPVRNKEGHTLFFCRRSVQGKFYNYPEGVTKPVFGIDMIKPGTQSVIICESCINALTAVVYGYNAVALMGTGNTYQIQQLKELGIREYVLCFDGDDAGKRATEKLKKQLRQVSIIWSIDMPDGKDLNDCTKEEFDALYKERS